MEELGSPWLTVVTIVKDDLSGFEMSARSLAQQDLTDVEWVIVDSSADHGTIPRLITELGVVARHEWVRPSGIYPAMNVGLGRATGEYVYFLNAGDTLADAGVLATIRALAENLRPLWMYGQVRFVSTSGRVTVPPPFDYQAEKAALFSRGRFPPHQGTVVRTQALKELGGFDTSFLIVADYVAFLRMSTLEDPVTTPAVIAEFAEGGASSVQWRESIEEFHLARVDVLQPQGTEAWKEQFHTTSQYVRMGLARLLGRAGS